MKLAFALFRYFPFGGLQRDFLSIAMEALKRGNNVDVYTMSWESEPHAQDINVNILNIKGLSNHRRALNFSQELGFILQQNTYDSVIGFNKIPYLDWYFASDDCLAHKVEQTRLRPKYLLPRYRIFLQLEKAIFHPTSKTKIMVLTKGVKKHYMQCYQTPSGQFLELPPYVDRNRLESAQSPEIREETRKRLGLKSDEILFITVGSNYKIKGVDRSIRAIAHLITENKRSAHLLIVGKGNAKPYLRLAKRLHCEHHIHFLGVRKDISHLLAGADVFLHPARYETAGNVIIEALVAKLPVLVTDTTGYACHVTDAQAGQLIPNAPFDQITMNNLVNAMCDPELRKHFSQGSRNYAQKMDLTIRPELAVDLIESGGKSQPRSSLS